MHQAGLQAIILLLGFGKAGTKRGGLLQGLLAWGQSLVRQLALLLTTHFKPSVLLKSCDCFFAGMYMVPHLQPLLEVCGTMLREGSSELKQAAMGALVALSPFVVGEGHVANFQALVPHLLGVCPSSISWLVCGLNAQLCLLKIPAWVWTCLHN